MADYREAPQQAPFYFTDIKKPKSPGKTYEQLIAEELEEQKKQSKKQSKQQDGTSK